MPTTRPLTWIIVLLLASGCQKNSHPRLTTDELINQAHDYFNSNIIGSGKTPNSKNYRAKQSKTAQWQQATVRHLSTGDAIVIPILYKNNLLVASQSAPNKIFKLSDLTSLVIIRDTAGAFHSFVLTYIPDSTNTIPSQNGTYFVETWQGNSLRAPVYIGPKTQYTTQKTTLSADKKQSQSDIIITTCTEIDGYNYAVSDPDNGEYWSEYSCMTYNISINDDINLPGQALPGLAQTSSATASQIIISPPTAAITNIADYFKCFSNGVSADHSYSVQICVDQPNPGTRQAWGLTPGGPSGSSSTGNPVNTGHVFLIMTENNQGNIVTRNVGFFPSGFVFPTTNQESSQGILSNDQSHDYNISLTISLSGNQFFDILNYISLGNNPGFYYNLNTNNCTTFVINAMSAGGIYLFATQGFWPGGSGYDPGDLGEDIRGMSLTSNETRNTVENSHPNVGSCN